MNRWNNSSKLRASSYPSYMKRISASGGSIASDELTLAFFSRYLRERPGLGELLWSISCSSAPACCGNFILVS